MGTILEVELVQELQGEVSLITAHYQVIFLYCICFAHRVVVWLQLFLVKSHFIVTKNVYFTLEIL